MSAYSVPATPARRTSSGAHYTGKAVLKSVCFNSTATGGVFQITDNGTVIAEATCAATGSQFLSFGDGLIVTTDITSVIPGTGSCVVHYTPIP